MKFRNIIYSKEQKIFLVIICWLIVLVFVVNEFITNNNKSSSDFIPDSTTLSQIADFENSLETIQWHRNNFSSYKNNYSHQMRERFCFDPNTIDSADFIRLGFKPFMAHNLLNYRRHGGRIYNIEKFRKIYGIDSLLIDSLSSLISFPLPQSESKKRSDSIRFIPKSYFSFEINSADSSVLQKLPNIGPARASMIISYRNRLGGFHSFSQLYEIEGIPDSVLDSLHMYVDFETDSLKKIAINHCSIKRLKRHPYINYYQAKAIYNLRWDNSHKGVLSLEDLYSIKEFSEDEISKLIPYLEF